MEDFFIYEFIALNILVFFIIIAIAIIAIKSIVGLFKN